MASGRPKRSLSVKEVQRMLEDSDIEDLHCDELDSSSSSTHSSSDTETEPVVQPAKRSKLAECWLPFS